ncbi:MAG: magnesium transporter [Bacteroidia bacterium]|nr:magnesium transporter [Bacteroidia bacterium]
MAEITTQAARLFELLEQNNFLEVKDAVTFFSVHELVDIAPLLKQSEQLLLFKALDRENAYQIFENLEENLQEDLLDVLPYRQLQLILNDMSPDKRTALLEKLPLDKLNRQLKLLTTVERDVAISLLGYPENSIGRLMTPDYITIKPEWTVQQVLDHIRQNGENKETLDVLYIVDESGKLIDDIRVRDFLVAPTESHVSELNDGKFVALHVTDDEEVAVNIFKQHNRVALPVLDANGVLLGIITIDDILQLAEQEDTEDIQKLGAVEALEDPYMDTPYGQMLRKRAPWLIALFVGELFTASAMIHYEDAIAKAVVLATFIPLIVSSGGNSGSQASTLIIRAMALGEVTLTDWWRIIKREFFMGLSLGVILAAIGFFRIAAFEAMFNSYGEAWRLVGLTVATTIIGVVTWGSILGSMLPLILKRLGADPATSSNPFVATMVDVTGLVIYFTLAVWLLKDTLL